MSPTLTDTYTAEQYIVFKKWVYNNYNECRQTLGITDAWQSAIYGVVMDLHTLGLNGRALRDMRTQFRQDHNL